MRFGIAGSAVFAIGVNVGMSHVGAVTAWDKGSGACGADWGYAGFLN